MSHRCNPTARPVPEEVRRAADLLERRWLLSVLWAAHSGAVRFNEFLRRARQRPAAHPGLRLVGARGGRRPGAAHPRHAAAARRVPADARRASSSGSWSTRWSASPPSSGPSASAWLRRVTTA